MYPNPRRDTGQRNADVSPSALGMVRPDEILTPNRGMEIPPPVPPRTYSKQMAQRGMGLNVYLTAKIFGL